MTRQFGNWISIILVSITIAGISLYVLSIAKSPNEFPIGIFLNMVFSVILGQEIAAFIEPTTKRPLRKEIHYIQLIGYGCLMLILFCLGVFWKDPALLILSIICGLIFGGVRQYLWGTPFGHQETQKQ